MSEPGGATRGGRESRSTQRWWSPPPFSTAASGWALLPLRGFLAVTFTFAGLQKLANPGFFDTANPISIQSQLAQAAGRSPLSFLITHLQHAAVPIGVAIALGELAVGLGTGLGLFTRVAACGGLALSLSLFLTVSFHSSPYYTGSDIVFVFAWVPMIVAGSGGVLALDSVVPRLVRRRSGEGLEVGSVDDIDRRTFVAKSLATLGVGGMAVVLAGLGAGIGRMAGRSSGPSAAPDTPTLRKQPSRSGAGTSAASSPAAAGSASSAAHPSGSDVGSASYVPVGGAASFTDPATGDPALVVQPEAGTFVAFDAVCPHEGCTVQFYESSDRFICPCHGSEFNGRTGALLRGPATRGLTEIQIAEGPDGQLYAV